MPKKCGNKCRKALFNLPKNPFFGLIAGTRNPDFRYSMRHYHVSTSQKKNFLAFIKKDKNCAKDFYFWTNQARNT